MSTERQSDPFRRRLNAVEAVRVQPHRESESRDARISKPSARRMDFDAVRQRYCDVIRELEMTTAEHKAIRSDE